MKTNRQLEADVLCAIHWEPLLRETTINAVVQDGVVTLSGEVGNYIQKSQAEDVVKRISGVKAVVEKIEVVFDNDDHKSDAAIAIEVLNTLKVNKDIPFDRIQIEVEDGHVTLEGKLEWNYQKQAVQKAASAVEGIKVLTNHIEIETDRPDDIEKANIEQAIERNWAMNNQDIQVYVSGNKVTLHGIVHSFYQKEEAERMAWNAPGVRRVYNELIIDYND